MKTTLGLLCLLCASAAGAASFLDASFNPGTGANGLIETVLPLSNGKMLVCGNFTTFNGTSSSYVAQLNADGSVDPTFNASPSYWVRTMALQPDGKIVIGGFFTSVSGQSRNLVARLNSNGSLDTTFDPGTGATGTLGGAIDGDTDPFVFATAVQSDGKILITGNFTNYNGATRWGITRLNSDGSLDTNFDVGAGFNTNSWGRSLLIQANNQIMVTGWFTSYNNHSFSRMVRLNQDGSADDTFNPNFGDLTAIYGVLQYANGEYQVVGDSENTNAFTQDMARLENDGSFDPSFVGQDNGKTESVRLQADGKLLIGGYFNEVDGITQRNLARINQDGTLDTNFTPNIDNFVWSMAVQPDSRILIVGGFATVEGASRNSIARLLPEAGNSSSGGGSNSTPANSFQGLVGTYSGLFYNAAVFTNFDAGYFTLTLGARGNYTARLALNGAGYAWGGTFDTNFTAQKTINRGRLDPIVVILDLPGDTSVQGSVAIGSLSSTLTAYRSTFSRTNEATSYATRYTALLTGGEAGAPAGDGWLALTVTKLGEVVMGGALADGVSISRVATLSSTGMTPFYASYRNGTATALGWLTLGTNVQGSIYWAEKGFSAALPVKGSTYVALTRSQIALASSNMVLTVSGGDLTAPSSANVTLEPVARFVFASSTNHFSAALNPVNGAFAGSVLDPETHRYEGFRGAVVQNQDGGGGYFGTKGGLVTLSAATP